MGLVGFDFPGDFRATVAFNSCTCRQVRWTGPQVIRLKICWIHIFRFGWEKQTNEMYSSTKKMEVWLVVSNIFYVYPYLGKISNLTHIFQMG